MHSHILRLLLVSTFLSRNERNEAYVLFNITKCPAKSTERKPVFWGYHLPYFLRLGCVFDYCFRLFEGQNKEHTL